ncbi:hypothetical protein IWQ60_009121 [Tieghemiomyces parasiticus]|uniref:Uncharacterized protein n=1 Tax=Tieghemiomyces parasiticus TaxID=78921 RepID=A0A9W8DQ55_9FUNG|nr:hypothetical protein IWQ60_009121 [Tieghemiomyces parasiticus]
MHCDVGCLNQCRTPLPIDPGHYVGGGKRPAPDDDLDYCEDDAGDVPYDELPYCEDLPPFQFPIMQLASSTQVCF